MTISSGLGLARPRVCVQGLGFVGAAMAIAVATSQDAEGEPLFDVVGVDLPTPLGRARVAKINAGEFPFDTGDVRLVAAARSARNRGNLQATCDPSAFADADIVTVDVHLDVDTTAGAPRVDFDPFRDAIRCVGERIRPGTLVLVETTVPPGTCERIVAPELSAAFRARGLPEDGFLLAHSYERVMPGDHYLESITHFWRVYAGLTPEASDACERFLSQVIHTAEYPLTRLGSITASETAKVMENSYRATNIAFVEEWARFAEAIGVNLFDVIGAIRVRPTHSNIRQPGFGVGGYCLTKDPLFPGVAARQLLDRPDLGFPFSEMAVATNQRMPMASIARLETALSGGLMGKRILLMGIAYRQDVADTRYSPSELFVSEARRRGAEILFHDPLVRHWNELGTGVPSALPPSGDLDAVVLAVPHTVYRELDLGSWLASGRPLVLDASAVLTTRQREDVLRVGCTLIAIGEG